MSRPALVLLALLAASVARAEPLPARDLADVHAPGGYSVGILSPLKVGLHDGLELQTHPLVFFVSPNAVVRVAHGALLGFRFTGEYGLSLPTPAMKLSQGYLFPAWEEGGGEVGWFLVPRVGLVATRGDPASRTLTLRADVAVGVPLTKSDATAPGGVAPLDDLFAPVFAGFRTRVGVSYDARLVDWLRVRAGVGVSLHGTTPEMPSPVAFNAGLGLDLAVGKRSRFTLGVVWWNADTRAIDARTHERVRSNDFLPTLDFIWAG